MHNHKSLADIPSTICNILSSVTNTHILVSLQERCEKLIEA